MAIDAMNLEDIFRQVQTNTSDLHAQFSLDAVELTADRNPRRKGGVHTIGTRRSRVIFGVALVVGAVMSSAFLRGE